MIHYSGKKIVATAVEKRFEFYLLVDDELEGGCWVDEFVSCWVVVSVVVTTSKDILRQRTIF